MLDRPSGLKSTLVSVVGYGLHGWRAIIVFHSTWPQSCRRWVHRGDFSSCPVVVSYAAVFASSHNAPPEAGERASRDKQTTICVAVKMVSQGTKKGYRRLPHRLSKRQSLSTTGPFQDYNLPNDQITPYDRVIVKKKNIYRFPHFIFTSQSFSKSGSQDFAIMQDSARTLAAARSRC